MTIWPDTGILGLPIEGWGGLLTVLEKKGRKVVVWWHTGGVAHCPHSPFRRVRL